MFKNISNYRILLASKSPRRRELLQMMRIPFSIVSLGGIEESYPKEMPVREVPEFLSRLKADAFLKHINEEELIITADTIVINNDKILGKPHSHEEALEMLKSLSGKTHSVISGVTIATLKKAVSFSVETEVTFGHITDDEINFYVENYRPFDKAGAYGIQEWIGGVAVESIHGSYYNVMGLPIHRLYNELMKF